MKNKPTPAAAAPDTGFGVDGAEARGAGAPVPAFKAAVASVSGEAIDRLSELSVALRATDAAATKVEKCLPAPIAREFSAISASLRAPLDVTFDASAAPAEAAGVAKADAERVVTEVVDGLTAIRKQVESLGDAAVQVPAPLFAPVRGLATGLGALLDRHPSPAVKGFGLGVSTVVAKSDPTTKAALDAAVGAVLARATTLRESLKKIAEGAEARLPAATAIDLKGLAVALADLVEKHAAAVPGFRLVDLRRDSRGIQKALATLSLHPEVRTALLGKVDGAIDGLTDVLVRVDQAAEGEGDPSGLATAARDGLRKASADLDALALAFGVAEPVEAEPAKAPAPADPPAAAPAAVTKTDPPVPAPAPVAKADPAVPAPVAPAAAQVFGPEQIAKMVGDVVRTELAAALKSRDEAIAAIQKSLGEHAAVVKRLGEETPAPQGIQSGTPGRPAEDPFAVFALNGREKQAAGEIRF